MRQMLRQSSSQPSRSAPLCGLKIFLHDTFTHSLSPGRLEAIKMQLVERLGAACAMTGLQPSAPQQVTHVVVNGPHLDAEQLRALAEQLRPALQAIQAAHPTLELTPEALGARMRVVDRSWLQQVLQYGRRIPSSPHSVPAVLEAASRLWLSERQQRQGIKTGDGDTESTAGAPAAEAAAAPNCRDGSQKGNDNVNANVTGIRNGSGSGSGSGASLMSAAAEKTGGNAAPLTRLVTHFTRRAISPRPGPPPASDAPLARFCVWLGEWRAELDKVSLVAEFVLYGIFDSARCVSIGNGAIDAALRELVKYEEALAGPRDNTERLQIPTSHASRTSHPPRLRAGKAAGVAQDGDVTTGRAIAAGSGLINHQALNYAHAAAVVRACAFRITSSMSPQRLQHELPYIGPFTARIIYQLAVSQESGPDAAGSSSGSSGGGCSCEPLEAFRADLPARDSRGRLRPGTEGASTRRMFCSLPGCGPVLAKYWWDQGFRTFEQLQSYGAAARREEGLKSAERIPEPGAEGPGGRAGGFGGGGKGGGGSAGQPNWGSGGGGDGAGGGSFNDRKRKLRPSVMQTSGDALVVRAGDGDKELGDESDEGSDSRQQPFERDATTLQTEKAKCTTLLETELASEGMSSSSQQRQDVKHTRQVSVNPSESQRFKEQRTPPQCLQATNSCGAHWNENNDQSAMPMATTAVDPQPARSASYIRHGGGGRSSSRGAGGLEGWFRGEVWYSLVYRDHLGEVVRVEEVAEMRQALLNALASTSSSRDWLLLQVGGGRRGRATEDVDFLATLPDTGPALQPGSGMEGWPHGAEQLPGPGTGEGLWREKDGGGASGSKVGGAGGRGERARGGSSGGGFHGDEEPLVVRLYRRLTAVGRVVPLERGFCRLQVNQEPGYIDALKRLVATGRWAGQEQMDRYDHIWCIWITGGGRRRRLDVMLVPYGQQWPYAVVGWTGSKQFLRFMRQHTLNCGMFTNSHAMLRQTPGGVFLVPQEALPTDSDGREFRPPNWVERGGLEQQELQQGPMSAWGSSSRVYAAAFGNRAGSPRTPPDAAQESRPGREGRRADHHNITASETACSAGSNWRDIEVRDAGGECLRPVASERDIFELLRLPYRDPHERNA